MADREQPRGSAGRRDGVIALLRLLLLVSLAATTVLAPSAGQDAVARADAETQASNTRPVLSGSLSIGTTPGLPGRLFRLAAGRVPRGPCGSRTGPSHGTQEVVR